MKQVWITSLDENREQVQNLMGLLGKYGLDSNGSFWIDDLKKHAWLGHKGHICDTQTALWLILGSENSFQSESVRYGLSLLALSVQAARGSGFPILFVTAGDETISPDIFPTPLKNCDILAMDNPALGPKLVAKANMPVRELPTDYRIDVHAHESFGLWFEVGPAAGCAWEGAMLGIDSGSIDFHGVGTAGKLPEKAVLEYPVKGITLKSGDREFSAWAVQNKIDSDMSYYVRVQDIPSYILFGPYSPDNEILATILKLT